MRAFRLLGEGPPETFRCRVYGDETSEADRRRLAFVRTLAREGVLDCPAYDRWIEKLQERGWLAEPTFERVPEGGASPSSGVESSRGSKRRSDEGGITTSTATQEA